MSKVDIGKKRICVSCSARFYDLGKNPAACPKCNTMNDINAPVRVRKRVKSVVEVDQDDPLVKQKAKQEMKNKVKKSSRTVEGVDLDDFEDVALPEGEDEIEEIEEIDDMESLEELEELEDVEEDEPMDDDIVIDDDTLIDDIEEEEMEEYEEEEYEEEEEDDDSSKKTSKGKKTGR